ncbi:MAG: LysR family transcriptional regulator [Burkholderiaceae bacterium]|jgi:DNA-binding transcriptional LysR family regulator|nr:LysR family transcriptional regulator [Burkholderiaceae bacterium]
MTRHFDDISLGSLELFCLTGDLLSFTAAANAAGLTPPAVSRTVARLEARLGAQLFVRTTRKLRLTDAGRAYHEQCKLALTQLVDAERELSGEQGTPSGTVRVSLPTPYGHFRVLPLLGAFRARYPKIDLELHLSNRNVDFAAENFDFAIRGRTPPDSGLVARKLEDAALVVVASPQYLRRRGTPRSVAALAGHDCIHFTLPSTGQIVPWVLRDGGTEVEHTGRGAMRCLDDILAPVTLARAGAGIVQTYRFIVERELTEGALKEILIPHAGASRPFSLLFPASRHMPQRVRVLIDFLIEQLGRHRHAV